MSAHALASPFPLRLAGDRRVVRASIGSRRNPASHAAILEAAAELLAELGPAGVTIDAVARRARAGKPTVYRWWPDKLALFVELHARETAALAAPAADLRTLATTILTRWTTTLAGPALRAVVAEGQASDSARSRMSAALAVYRDAIAVFDVDADATLDAWLAAFLFRPADAAVAIARTIDAPAAIVVAPPVTPSVVDRRGWVD